MPLVYSALEIAMLNVLLWVVATRKWIDAQRVAQKEQKCRIKKEHVDAEMSWKQ